MDSDFIHDFDSPPVADDWTKHITAHYYFFITTTEFKADPIETSSKKTNKKKKAKGLEDQPSLEDYTSKEKKKLKDLNTTMGENLEDFSSVGSMSSQAELARQLGLQNVESISSPYFTIPQMNGLQQQLEVLGADVMTRNKLFLGKAKNMLEAYFSGHTDKMSVSHAIFFNYLREKLNQSLDDTGHHSSLQDLQQEIVKLTIPVDLTDENQVRAWDAKLRALCDKYHKDKVIELDELDGSDRTN